MKQSTFSAILAYFLAFALLYMAFYIWTSMPVMVVDSMGTCIKVESMGNQYHCGNPPKRYDVRIVR
jgi:hypothetical protein